METDSSALKYLDESIEQCQKIVSQGSTSSPSKANNNCPIMNLPPDILAKIIVEIPVAQWPSLELLDEKFHDAILIAWRQLRTVNVDRDFTIKSDIKKYAISFPNTAAPFDSFLHKLTERSPFLTSLSGIDSQLIKPRSSYVSVVHTICCWRVSAKLNSDRVASLSQFAHLQSMTMGDMDLPQYSGPRRIPLEAVVEFLESTRSRTSLKELHLYNVVQQQEDRSAILDRFAASFVNGREIWAPIMLEKFLFTSTDDSLHIRLDPLNTTRLTDVRLAKASIEPEQLTNLIERASNLLRIDLSFLPCKGDCNGPRLDANKKLLKALAFQENLTSIKFDCVFINDDNKCMNFVSEFIEMLKMIGRRGKLRKLALVGYFAFTPIINMDQICTEICKHIPYLRSIKLYTDRMSTEAIFRIVSMTELEEVHLSNWDTRVTANCMKQIAQLPHLKRLALTEFDDDEDSNALKCLANSMTLIELRIAYTRLISADVLEKWSEGFASNLKVLMLAEYMEEVEHTEQGLIRLLEKATQLRVLFLGTRITEQALMTIAKSCPELEVLIITMDWSEIPNAHLQLQEILDRCPKLKKWCGFGGNIRLQYLKKLQFPKYRKIEEVGTDIVHSYFGDFQYD